MLANKRKKNLLLYSRDHCRTWQVHELPPGTFSVEHWTGHNEIAGPPPIALMTSHAPHPARFASRNALRLLFPRKTRKGLDLGEPVLVTNDCFGMAQHSGGASFAATRDGKTHIVWAEVTDEKVPGSPTYVATYDHATGRLGDKVFLAYAPPINDVHNTPSICLDSEGYLHVITGAHGASFYYLRSKHPHDATGGWTTPAPTLTTGHKGKDGKESGRQTYLAFVCDPNDTLHIAFRQWRRGVDPYHTGRLYAALSYQRKKKGQPWEDGRPLLVSPVPSYSIFYHKLGMDHRGRLYLSYSYWSTAKAYKGLPGRYHFRSMLCSRDAGHTWHLATTGDFR